MGRTIPARNEIAIEDTWDLESIFPSEEAWQQAFEHLAAELPSFDRFRGHLGDNPQTLANFLDATDNLRRTQGKVFTYARLSHATDTADERAKAMSDRAGGLMARSMAALAFAQPEILAIGQGTLQQWMQQEPRLKPYEHFFDQIESARAHIRSAEVEEILGLVMDPFSTAAATHSVLTDTDLIFEPALTAGGERVEVGQGSYGALLSDSDRELRRTAYESYSRAHLAYKHTMANALAAGIKRDVFMARARHYNSSLEAALAPQHLPVEVFHTLIAVFQQSLPLWHRYWSVRRQALGYDQLHVYDIKAPLATSAPHVPFARAVDMIVEGMKPLGTEYVEALRRGTMQERWVDKRPNRGKSGGAFSSGSQGTHPYILMSYTDDLYSMSTLAHELGHSLHSYFTWQNQPPVYSRYGMFVAETASNFNQAMVRGHLLQRVDDRDFQITLIEEAMSNFHRYFFIMPTLARFELALHERAERGGGLTADYMIDLMADLFAEGYGDEVVYDRQEIGITWAEFSHHLYANFYVFQYATGISAANALASGILSGKANAAEDYLGFLKAGGSLYPIEALKLAGVDMTTRQPVEEAFKVMGQYVERLAQLTGQTAAAPA